MLGWERGTCSGSDLYFQTPSENAHRMLYYMTSCGYYYTDYDYRIERDDYHNYLIFYICEGRLSVRSEDRTMVAGPGQIGFLNCHVPHEYHTIGNTEFVWLHLDGANTAQFYQEIADRHDGFVFSTPCAEEIKQRIYEIIYACRNEQLLNEIQLSYKLYGILTALLDETANHSTERSPSSSTVEAAMQFIHTHYSEPISLPEVAQRVNMSQYHFSRLFKKECGYSPHEYIILLRLNHAKHLLKTTDMPVKTVAHSVGYQNVVTFTNAFTNRVGLSPGKFRKYPV